MTPFPLPMPTTAAESQPAEDLGGVVVTYRCAPELARYAVPVIDRLRQRHERAKVEDGLTTSFGFSQWRLRQDGDSAYALTATDYAVEGEPDDVVTDDLTRALWVEASQADAVRRAGVHRQAVDRSSRVSFTQAAATAVGKGHGDELVLVRRRPVGTSDSGWFVRTTDPTIERNEEVEVRAGRLVAAAPHLVPYLTLPAGTVVRVAEGRFLGAWWTRAGDGTVTATDHQLLDEEGHGPGVHRGDDAARSRTTIERLVSGVTLRARVHPGIAQLGEAVLMSFEPESLRPGGQLQSTYVPFTLEAGDEGGVLLVTTPDFSSPSAYREQTTDDLTAALVTEAEQSQMALRAGVAAAPIRADEVVSIQQGALDDLTHHRPTSYVMERVRPEAGAESLPDGARRSGWSIVAPSAQSERSRTVVHVDAGELQACDDMFAPYYALPVGSLLEFAHGNLHSAHLVDEAQLAEVVRAHPERTMHDLLESGEISRPLFQTH